MNYIFVSRNSMALTPDLIAGTETSATTLSWWTKYMTIHPEIQHKLRSEVLKHLPEIQDRPPTMEELNGIPYLEAVVHETLRLSRTASGYARESEPRCE